MGGNGAKANYNGIMIPGFVLTRYWNYLTSSLPYPGTKRP